MKRRDFVATAALAFTPTPFETMGQAQENQPDVRKPRIIVVSAHPADFCIRAGGTMIKHVRAGSKVKVVWLSHGETEESQLLHQQRPGISLEDVRRIREKEAFAAAAVIGVEGRMFGFGDNPLRMTPERTEMLVRELADFKPDIILTHWKNETADPTHWQTSQSAIQAAQLANGSWDIRFFEPTIGFATRDGFIPDYCVDISDVFAQKMEATKKLATQPQLVESYSTCARWRGLEIGRPYAEAFAYWGPKPRVQGLLNE